MKNILKIIEKKGNKEIEHTMFAFLIEDDNKVAKRHDIKKFPKKEKIIIFTGKLNTSKGYDVFGKSIINVLNKFTKWKAYAIGNERRESHSFKHKNFTIIDWLPHEKILNFYKKSSISVVCSRWQEPFGRTAMESAAYGCATITTNRGGLSETFDNNLVLKNLKTSSLEKIIIKIIQNKKLLHKIQRNNFKNVIHKMSFLTNKIDNLKCNFLTKKINYIKNNNLKILHVSTFDEKNNHRLFNLSIANKLTKGFIRNGHDVVNFSYRDYRDKFMLKNKKVVTKQPKKILTYFKIQS